MHKNSALLSIGAALLCSLFVVDVGHAFQIDRSQDAHIQMAADMNSLTGVSLLAAGILFGAGLIALVGLGARRLRHPHGHHA